MVMGGVLAIREEGKRWIWGKGVYGRRGGDDGRREKKEGEG